MYEYSSICFVGLVVALLVFCWADTPVCPYVFIVLVISTAWEISRYGFARSIDKHKPIATRTALTLSVLRATYRCLCCRTKLSSLRSVGMTASRFAFALVIALLLPCRADTSVCPYYAGAFTPPSLRATSSMNRGGLKFLYFTLKLKIPRWNINT